MLAPCGKQLTANRVGLDGGESGSERTAMSDVAVAVAFVTAMNSYELTQLTGQILAAGTDQGRRVLSIRKWFCWLLQCAHQIAPRSSS